jgi:phosphoribosylformylglycinamidine (FGAM) synthase-like enzyme
MVVVIGSGSPVSLTGSEYLEIVHGRVAGMPPNPDIVSEKEVADLLCGMVRSGLVDTAHDIAGGGEIVAVAEMVLAGGLGIRYTEGEFERKIAGQGGGRTDVALYGEEFGAFVVAVPWERWADFQAAIPGNIGYDQIGTVGGDRLTIPGLIDLSLSELRSAYERDLFEAHAPEGGHIG